MSNRSKRVALLIESSRAYGRGLLRGIAAYARTHPDWSLYHDERAIGNPPPRWIEEWQGDGIIARIETRRIANAIRAKGLPCVDVRGSLNLPGIPIIRTEGAEVVRMACDELLGRGFRSFAWTGFAGADYSLERRDLTIAYLEERGLALDVFDSPGPHRGGISNIEAEAQLHSEELGQWLLGLEKPIAMVACNDIRAMQVLTVCRDLSIRVPGEVALMGIDNDDLICDLSDPPLSSVENDTEKIGFEAATLLSSMIEGAEIPTETILIPPLGVVSRRSTDILAVDDAEVLSALHFIQEHACEGISVDEVANILPVSRSTLERRFSKVLGRSLKSEINRVRLQKIKQILVDTDYKLPVVAKMVGFAQPEYMQTMFASHVGMTPGQYRKQHRK